MRWGRPARGGQPASPYPPRTTVGKVGKNVRGGRVIPFLACGLSTAHARTGKRNLELWRYSFAFSITVNIRSPDMSCELPPTDVSFVAHGSSSVPLFRPGIEREGSPDKPAADQAVANQAIASHAGAGFFCEQLVARQESGAAPGNILIAGCGAGHEAVAIQQQLRANVEAVDVEDFVGVELKERSAVRFRVASVCALPFPEATFDAVFYYHVIEHVARPAASLAELARVLRPGGWLFVGTPNRQRLVSSIGAHQQSEWEATWRNKLGDNLRDWKDRLTGQFKNELGAHAGFSRRELDRLLTPHFTQRDWVTGDYLRYKYGASQVRRLLPLLAHPAVMWFAAPAIYVFARKPGLA